MYYELNEHERKLQNAGFGMRSDTKEKLSKKLSELQREILTWLNDHRGQYHSIRDRKQRYRDCKFEIAQISGKTEPSQRTYTIRNKKFNERVKESFHPVFRTAWKALIKRGLVDGWGLTDIGYSLVER